MEAYLNRIDGLDDALITMYLSKRNMNRKKELEIREMVAKYVTHSPTQTANFQKAGQPKLKTIGALKPEAKNDMALCDALDLLLKWGTQHITLLRFIDLSFSIYGMHRGGQDDIDAHSYRMQNHVIRASTQLGTFETGEMSEYYQGKIVPTDIALAYLGITVPDEIEVDGQVYTRSTNGYILKGHEKDKDYRRGLYMLSIPSDFVFKLCLTEFAHVYKMRNEHGTANPEVKTAIESLTDQLWTATLGFVTRKLLTDIPN